jgi:PAS domain S-box-containing protein
MLPEFRDGFFASPNPRTMAEGRDLFALTKEGKEVPVEIGLNPFETAHGLHVLCTIVDITERKQTDHAVRRLAAIVDSASDAIIGKDLEGVITSWNRAAERLYGWTTEEVVGGFIGIIVPEARREELGRIMAAVRRGERLENFETLRVRKDGSTVEVSLTISPIADGRGRLVGASTIARDITERNEAERELRRSAAELARSNRDLQQFAYVASHDLKEPLRMVTSYLQLLEERYGDRLDAEGKEFCGFAVNGARRMHSLINDLLEYSRVDTQERELKPTESQTVFDHALQNLKTAVEESGAVVTHGDLPRVRADSSQLAQLLQNLIGNAIKFRGEEAPRIHVMAEAQDAWWRFSVADNGIGIDPRYHHRIFQIFQRLHGGRTYPGTGVGLAICQKIVERHGGSIWVESAPGRGSTFFFTLPREGGADVPSRNR